MLNQTMDNVKSFFFSSELPPLDDGPEEDSIDHLNEETFGSGAVAEDWETEHNNYAGQELPLHNNTGGTGKPLNEDELELSNRQLAAAVEELVLNSDQDQDAIDPAIVSLRKESRHGVYDPILTENLVSSYSSGHPGFGQPIPPFSLQNSSLFQAEGLRNIWSNTDLEVRDTFGKSQSMILERHLLNEKLKDMMQKNKSPAEFEDEAILTAVKASPRPSSTNWSHVGQVDKDIIRQMFPGNKPAILTASDLQKEFSKSDLRVPSPTFGISIPKDGQVNHNGIDRSLPARSISPVIGSPTSPRTLPIGTPPKHITNLLLHAHKQDVGMQPSHPSSRPLAPAHFHRPPQGYVMPSCRIAPPDRMGNVWPPGLLNRPPANPLAAQEIMNKIGMNQPLPVLVGSPPARMSPMGSPRFVQAPHIVAENHNFTQGLVQPGTAYRRPMPQMRPSPNHRFGGPRPIVYLGPGHLHPEHSRFVRMRRQRSGEHRQYNQRSHRTQNRDSPSRDPCSNLMTSREKEWVVKIQMMALQSDRPEIDDYYYQHYIDKRLQEGRLSFNEGNEQKRLITPTKTNADHKKYVPVQYDKSLGKLTVSSVYNPRQIIDVIHAEKEEELMMEPSDAKASMRKRLEVYSYIEKAYSAVLEIEEIKFRSINSTEEPQENKENVDRKEKRAESCLRTLEELLFPDGMTEFISQCLRIRKGKRLICRVLPHVPLTSALKIIKTLLKQLPVLIKRDQKQDVLQELYSPVCRILKQLDVSRLLEVSSIIVPLSHIICRDKLGFSIMCKLLVLGNRYTELKKMSSGEKENWDQYVSSCFKAFLSFGEKKTVIPIYLERKLEAKVMAVFENQSKDISVGDDRRKEHLKEIKAVLSVK